eukprot:139567_1
MATTTQSNTTKPNTTKPIASQSTSASTITHIWWDWDNCPVKRCEDIQSIKSSVQNHIVGELHCDTHVQLHIVSNQNIRETLLTTINLIGDFRRSSKFKESTDKVLIVGVMEALIVDSQFDKQSFHCILSKDKDFSVLLPSISKYSARGAYLITLDGSHGINPTYLADFGNQTINIPVQTKPIAIPNHVNRNHQYKETNYNRSRSHRESRTKHRDRGGIYHHRNTRKNARNCNDYRSNDWYHNTNTSTRDRDRGRDKTKDRSRRARSRSASASDTSCTSSSWSSSSTYTHSRSRSRGASSASDTYQDRKWDGKWKYDSVVIKMKPGSKKTKWNDDALQQVKAFFNNAKNSKSNKQTVTSISQSFVANKKISDSRLENAITTKMYQLNPKHTEKQ